MKKNCWRVWKKFHGYEMFLQGMKNSFLGMKKGWLLPGGSDCAVTLHLPVNEHSIGTHRQLVTEGIVQPSFTTSLMKSAWIVMRPKHPAVDQTLWRASFFPTDFSGARQYPLASPRNTWSTCDTGWCFGQLLLVWNFYLPSTPSHIYQRRYACHRSYF